VKLVLFFSLFTRHYFMAPHVKALSSSCFYHIRSFRQIRPSLDDSMAASVASALISSRLDQLNSILYGTPLKHTARLQRIQHAAARVVLYQHSRTSPLSSNELLKQLHWLPIEWRIRFNLPPRPSKLCTLITRHIFLTSCNIMNLRGLWAHPVLISS